MASTYVNDLRLNEMATGDASGTWGTVTNTNLELIAEAFSFGTEAITTNADTHTTTIADGATDPGRSIFLKYTGTLDSACTITIGPNTVSKLWFIENATSGSQNIIISQGSGASITIANGQTKAIYSDGAGSGAAMVDAFTDLAIPSLFVEGATTMTVADNSAVLTLKSTDADENSGPLLALTRDSSSPADDDFTGLISFNADDDGGNVTRFALIRSQIKDASDGSEDGSMDIKTMVAGSERSRVVFGSAETNFNEGGVDLDFRVESDGSTHALFVQASDSAIGINNSSPTAKLHIVEATSTPAVKIKSGTSTNQNTHITMFNDDDGGTLALGVFGSSATTFGPITAGDAFVTSNQELVLNSQNSSGVIKFGVGSTPSEAMRIDSSGRLLVGKTTTAFGTEGVRIDPNNIQVTRDGNTALYLNRLSSSGDLIELYRAGSVAATIGVEAYGIVFNEGGAALDFRVESDDRTHMFFVDASGNGVGIGDTTAPGRFLHVQRNSDTDFTTDTFIADSAAIINNATSVANNFASLAFATEANG